VSPLGTLNGIRYIAAFFSNGLTRRAGKAVFTVTHYPTAEGLSSNGWDYTSNTMVEDGALADSYTTPGQPCPNVWSNWIMGKFGNLPAPPNPWNLPAGAVVLTVKVQLKVRCPTAGHRLPVATSWDGGTNWTTWEILEYPTTLGWVEYDATQGHATWTAAELEALVTRFCSLDAVDDPPGRMDYCDVFKVVVTYEV